MTNEELKDLIHSVAHETARETVRETLRGLGADVDNPLEMQHDFATLRSWRVAMASVQKKTILTVVGLVVAGFCAAIWVGLREALSGK